VTGQTKVRAVHKPTMDKKEEQGPLRRPDWRYRGPNLEPGLGLGQLGLRQQRLVSAWCPAGSLPTGPGRAQPEMAKWGGPAFQSMIDFVVVSSDLRPYVLDTRVKRGAELVNRSPPGGELDPLAEEEVGQTWQTQTYCEGLLGTSGRALCQGGLQLPPPEELHHRFRGRLGTLSPSGPCSLPPLSTRSSSKLWTQGLWCLSWQATPEPGGGHRK
ncbi:hypothetical protein L3Q82_014429, partial [Scortum barcoo]